MKQERSMCKFIMFLFYLSSHFLKKVLYEIKEILSICVMQEITEKNDKISTRLIQTFSCINFIQACRKSTLIDRVEFMHAFCKLSGNVLTGKVYKFYPTWLYNLMNKFFEEHLKTAPESVSLLFQWDMIYNE